MKTVGFRLMLFGGAFLVYAFVNDEPQLKTVGGIFVAIGLALSFFTPKKR